MRLLLFFFFFPWVVFSQDVCGTSYDSSLYLFPSSRISNEWKEIPVAVHICYSDSLGGWFSEEYVEEAIADLNADMSEAMISVDLVHVGYKDLEDYSWYDSYAFNPNGNWCFPFFGTQNSILATDLSLPDWDPNYHCNIYVIPKMCAGILGWSYVTASATNARDGIWLRSDIFGLGSVHPRNNENKVLTHEMGHYCGLHHVFQSVNFCGDDGGLPCDVWGDFVCDTPPTKLQWECDPPMCPESLYNYTADNHMDYYPDSCRHHFTPGQVDRMHDMLSYQRAGLFGGYPICLGDCNGDYVVGISDLMLILSCWGSAGCLDGDINHSGLVNIYDLNMFLSLYGTICEGNILWK
jgi:hypothetical protein